MSAPVMTRAARLALLALAIALVPPAAGAAPARGSGGAPATGQAASAAEFELLGFRSARFGMTEEEVRRAIAKDFALTGDAVRAAEHLTERTQVLSVDVPDLLPGGGTATVGYVLGHSSKRLVQVGINWSATTDPALTPDRLIANAGVLSGALGAAGYRPETVAVNTLLPGGGGLLVFRGRDGKGRTAALVLHGETKPGPKEGDQVLTPTQLTLLYIADPDKPDVFTLAPGKF